MLAKRPEHRTSRCTSRGRHDRCARRAAPVAIRGRPETSPRQAITRPRRVQPSGRKAHGADRRVVAALAIRRVLLVRGGPGRQPDRNARHTRAESRAARGTRPAPTLEAQKPRTRAGSDRERSGDARISARPGSRSSRYARRAGGRASSSRSRSAATKNARVVIAARTRQMIQLESIVRDRKWRSARGCAKPTVKRPALGSDIVDPWGK